MEANQLPAKVILGLEDLSSVLEIAEQSLKVNIYNAYLLDEIVGIIKKEREAVSNINHVCPLYGRYTTQDDNHKAITERLRMISLMLFNTLRDNRLYHNGNLKYVMIGMENKNVILKREDLVTPEELLRYQVERFNNSFASEMRNITDIGLRRFIDGFR